MLIRERAMHRRFFAIFLWSLEVLKFSARNRYKCTNTYMYRIHFICIGSGNSYRPFVLVRTFARNVVNQARERTAIKHIPVIQRRQSVDFVTFRSHELISYWFIYLNGACDEWRRRSIKVRTSWEKRESRACQTMTVLCHNIINPLFRYPRRSTLVCLGEYAATD